LLIQLEAALYIKKISVSFFAIDFKQVPNSILVHALENNLIGAVGLDVTTPEPLPPSHKLYSFPNCLILPHVGSATMETRENMANMTLENILAGLNNAPLPYSL
jgi:glyoxylate/hydroxypyruvate reductase